MLTEEFPLQERFYHHDSFTSHVFEYWIIYLRSSDIKIRPYNCLYLVLPIHWFTPLHVSVRNGPSSGGLMLRIPLTNGIVLILKLHWKQLKTEKNDQKLVKTKYFNKMHVLKVSWQVFYPKDPCLHCLRHHTTGCLQLRLFKIHYNIILPVD
jgi:hypothetical protein